MNRGAKGLLEGHGRRRCAEAAVGEGEGEVGEACDDRRDVVRTLAEEQREDEEVHRGEQGEQLPVKDLAPPRGRWGRASASGSCGCHTYTVAAQR